MTNSNFANWMERKIVSSPLKQNLYHTQYLNILKRQIAPICIIYVYLDQLKFLGGVCFRNNGPHSGVLNQTNKRKFSRSDRLALPQHPTAMRLGDSPKQTTSESTVTGLKVASLRLELF